MSMIVSEQIRAARAALKWTIDDLSAKTDVSVRTIKRIEALDGVPSSHTQTLNAIRTALEAAGIEFIGTPTDRPGVRLRGGEQERD
ncbi:MAG: helix-turn-helix domain-containing protein [Rhodobacteraceae bacterium]|nr:MAG: helix-turn-helix domain-containing protein [Paracoccaceae bacterium]